MDNYKPTEEDFLEQVSRHKMTIELDQGVFRSILFSIYGQHSSIWFWLVTFPGHLAIAGDMGTYAFNRERDMFEFFRGKGIDVDYWTKKMVAESRPEKAFSFSEEKLKQFVNEVCGAECREAVRKADISCEYEALALIHEHEEIYDAIDLKEPTYQYIWCLRAISWGIEEYDKHNEEWRRKWMKK